jgi:hypothetical protein
MLNISVFGDLCFILFVLVEVHYPRLKYQINSEN